MDPACFGSFVLPGPPPIWFGLWAIFASLPAFRLVNLAKSGLFFECQTSFLMFGYSFAVGGLDFFFNVG